MVCDKGIEAGNTFRNVAVNQSGISAGFLGSVQHAAIVGVANVAVLSQMDRRDIDVRLGPRLESLQS